MYRQSRLQQLTLNFRDLPAAVATNIQAEYAKPTESGNRLRTVMSAAVATNIPAEYAKRNHSTGRIRKTKCGVLIFYQAEYAKHQVVCSFLSESNARDDLRRTAVSLGPNALFPKVFSS